MTGRLTLAAVARGDRIAAIARIEEAISACGWLLDARPFSGIYVAFTAELERPRLHDFARRLADAGVVLDEASAAALLDSSQRPEAGAVVAALGVTFPGGDPDLRQLIPEVPG